MAECPLLVQSGHAANTYECLTVDGPECLLLTQSGHLREGSYTGCNFSLEVGPVDGEENEEKWSDNPLSIIGASIGFDRKPSIDDANQRSARKGWFAR
jgi:hypothetical protein